MARRHADETKVSGSSPGLTLFVAVLKLFSMRAQTQFYSLDFKSIVARSNPSDKFDMFSDGILYMPPDNPPVSKISIGELAFQLFRTLFGATIESKRDFDDRNLKNA